MPKERAFSALRENGRRHCFRSGVHSSTGESGGSPRDVYSLDINTEDFQAAVDYLSNLPEVDPEKIGIIGICGWGGISLNAAANDPRIKATAAITMYDMPRFGAWGYFDQGNRGSEI